MRGINIIKLYKSKPIIKGVVIAAFLFCIGVNLYFRLFPAYFPQYRQQASQTVKNRIAEEINENINKVYPDYNFYAKNALSKELFKVRMKDKGRFKDEVNAEYNKLKDQFQDENGQTYLLELDPYHWARYTENVLKNGHPGDAIINGKPYDTYVLAPFGSNVCREQFLFYMSAYLYKAAVFFYKGLSLERFLFYLPLFYTAVFLILVYFFTKSVFSHLAAFFAVLFAGLNAMFIQRSCAGWFDSDSLSLTMPLLVVWCILLALKNGRHLGRTIIFALLAAFFQSLYVIVWTGWWFIFLVIIGFYGCSILNNYLIHQRDFSKDGSKNFKYFLSGGIFIIASIIFGSLITKQNFIYIIFISVKGNLHLGKSLSESIWPNTYYTVGELMSSNLSNLAAYLYGNVVFFVSLISMFWLFVKERRAERKDFFYIMFFWCVFMLFAALKSVRFAIFLSLPLGIFFGGFMGGMPKIVKKLSRDFKIRLGTAAGLVLISALFLRVFLTTGYTSVSYVRPLMDDYWQKALEYIKENTERETVVNSWWDYGDLFKAAADRRVIFDGQSQNTPLAYWMGQVLLAPDEDKALRILRMINNGSVKAFDLLNKHISNPYECLADLEKIMSMSEENAKAFLLNRGAADKDARTIMGYLYDKPHPAVFIVEESMLSKMHSISFLGNWDFRKLYVLRNMNSPKEEVVGNLINTFSLAKKEAGGLYEEMVITPSDSSIYEAVSKRYIFYSPFVEGEKRGDLVYFDNGLIYDLSAKQGIVYSLLNKKYKTVKNMFVYNDGDKQHIENAEANFDKGVVFVKFEDTYKSVVLEKELADSLFFRMYFLEGKGLRHFELLYKDEEAKIYAYKINWDKLAGSE